MKGENSTSSCYKMIGPDEGWLHAYFLGYELQQHPLIVVHFRPHLFPDKQIFGESVYHLEKTLPRSFREAREGSAGDDRDRIFEFTGCRRVGLSRESVTMIEILGINSLP